MNNINSKKELRFLILKRLYELTDGSELKQLDKEEVEKEIDATPQEISDAWRYLKNEYLANPVNMAVRISHGGVIAIEKALSEPNSPTEYFPPVTNIINVKEMHGSVIQQGNTNSTQSVTIETTTINELNEFLEKVKKAIPSLTLPEEAESEITADIETIETQLGSSRPKLTILKESLLSIQRILEGAGGAVLAHQLLPLIPGLISGLFK